jgi:hypothetical protein
MLCEKHGKGCTTVVLKDRVERSLTTTCCCITVVDHPLFPLLGFYFTSHQCSCVVFSAPVVYCALPSFLCGGVRSWPGIRHQDLTRVWSIFLM